MWLCSPKGLFSSFLSCNRRMKGNVLTGKRMVLCIELVRIWLHPAHYVSRRKAEKRYFILLKKNCTEVTRNDNTPFMTCTKQNVFGLPSLQVNLWDRTGTGNYIWAINRDSHTHNDQSWNLSTNSNWGQNVTCLYMAHSEMAVRSKRCQPFSLIVKTIKKSTIFWTATLQTLAKSYVCISKYKTANKLLSPA